mgnify:FL=1
MPGPLSVSPRPNEMSELQLQREGFSAEEIARLRELRDAYPYIEYVDTRREWQHLRFVKWLYARGQFKS